MLLYDQSLSYELVSRLADLFPGSSHVRQLGLERADDDVIWTRAGRDGLTNVSKDSDFHQRSLVFGPPPKLVWLRAGNSPSGAIESLLRVRHREVRAFVEDRKGAFLVLS